MMRVMARTVTRAGLPVRYSQGFNPHPRLSLPCPRPVSVASNDELLVLILDGPVEGKQILEKLNTHCPAGLRFIEAEQLSGSRTPRPWRIHYKLPVESTRSEALLTRLSELARRESWEIERRRTTRQHRSPSSRVIDLKPLTEKVSLDGNILHMVLVRGRDCWARLPEVLELSGLDPRSDLARMVRTEVEYEM
jgi:radical SAM-linked protein